MFRGDLGSVFDSWVDILETKYFATLHLLKNPLIVMEERKKQLTKNRKILISNLPDKINVEVSFLSLNH